MGHGRHKVGGFIPARAQSVPELLKDRCHVLAPRLSGAAVIGWSWCSQLADEADRRGEAVSTLASDVRILRAQVTAAGETPKAPDPSQAVKNLDDRTRVPVPIPGPQGPQGEPGKPAPTITPAPGASGAPGRNGSDSTAPGPAGPSGPPGDTVTGPPGPQGERGEQGPRGDAGAPGAPAPACPDGYSLQPPAWDPDALVCRKDSTPTPDPQPGKGANSQSLALDPQRRQYV